MQTAMGLYSLARRLSLIAILAVIAASAAFDSSAAQRSAPKPVPSVEGALHAGEKAQPAGKTWAFVAGVPRHRGGGDPLPAECPGPAAHGRVDCAHAMDCCVSSMSELRAVRFVAQCRPSAVARASATFSFGTLLRPPRR